MPLPWASLSQTKGGPEQREIRAPLTLCLTLTKTSSIIPGLGRGGFLLPLCPHLSLPPPGEISSVIWSIKPNLNMLREDLLAIPLFPQSLDFHTIVSIMRSRKPAWAKKMTYAMAEFDGSYSKWKLQENMTERVIFKRNPFLYYAFLPKKKKKEISSSSVYFVNYFSPYIT